MVLLASAEADLRSTDHLGAASATFTAELLELRIRRRSGQRTEFQRGNAFGLSNARLMPGRGFLVLFGRKDLGHPVIYRIQQPSAVDRYHGPCGE